MRHKKFRRWYLADSFSFLSPGPSIVDDTDSSYYMDYAEDGTAFIDGSTGTRRDSLRSRVGTHAIIVTDANGAEAWGYLQTGTTKALGLERVTDGACATDSFTSGAGWAYNAGDDDYDATASTSTIQQTISSGLTLGAYYDVEFELTAYTSGTAQFLLGVAGGTGRTSAAKFVEGGYYGGGGAVLHIAGMAERALTATADNMSVKRYTACAGVSICAEHDGSGAGTWNAVDAGFDATAGDLTIHLYFVGVDIVAPSGSITIPA